MRLPRRQFLLHSAGAVIALPALSRIAWAEAYPTRPVRLIVPFPAGGATDIVARLIGQWLSERLGQQFVIDNRPGAATNIATAAVVRAPPDGYTLLFAATAASINATLYEKLEFNFIRDIVPVAGIARVPLVLLVHPSVPAATVPELVAYLKASPGKISIATSGPGSVPHMSAELFKVKAGVDFVVVPYRGDALVLPDLLDGRVPMFYYIIHIYLLHLLAMPAAVILGFHWTDLASFQSSIHSVPRLKNYGFSLDILYCIWAGIVAVLYPLCKWYDEYKIKNKRKWWLSYL